MDFVPCSSNMTDSVNIMQDKIDKKQEECSLAEAEYAKYCAEFESSLKELQDIKAEKFQVESELRSLKYRIDQYDASMNRAIAAADETREKVDKIMIELEKERQLCLQNDEEYDKYLHSLAEEIHNNRQIHDRNVIANEIMKLSEQNEVVNRELQDVRNCLSEYQKQNPLIPDKSKNLMSINITKIISDLEKEQEKQKSQILTLERKRRHLEAMINI